MAGISSKALNGAPENRYKYNGHELQNKEFSDNSGLELYDYGARMQDPQLGRFWQIDPKCEIFPHYNPYNYCFNNPMLFVDPDGMLAKYNWDDGKYYDEGKEVSWDNVQQQYQIGEYSTTTSVMLTQKYADEKKTTLEKDYGSGALKTILDAALSAPGGHIKVVQAADANDAADQIEKIFGKIDLLFIASHGTTHRRQKAFFSIGSDFFQAGDIAGSSALSRIAAKMASTGGPLPSAASVILFACGAGGKYMDGDLLMEALAKKLHSVVYGPQAWGVAHRGIFTSSDPTGQISNTPCDRLNANPCSVNGLWRRTYEYGATTKTETIRNVYFDAFGRIHYTQ